MKIISFNFTKILIEKMKDVSKGMKISSKIEISSVSPIKSDFLQIKEDLLNVSFVSSIFYEPSIAQVEMKGNVILSMDSKSSKEILKEWKDKKIPEEFKISLFNIILKKSNIKALGLEEELNLPPHLPLVSLNKKEAK